MILIGYQALPHAHATIPPLCTRNILLVSDQTQTVEKAILSPPWFPRSSEYTESVTAVTGQSTMLEHKQHTEPPSSDLNPSEFAADQKPDDMVSPPEDIPAHPRQHLGAEWKWKGIVAVIYLTSLINGTSNPGPCPCLLLYCALC